MTKTTKRQGHTNEQVEAGWLAIEHYANGATKPRQGVERVEIGSEQSGFDLPPMR